MLQNLIENIAAIRERDPAARSSLEVLLCYPGLHAIAFHRVAHSLWGLGFRLPARMVSNLARTLTGIEIHPGAKIGRRVFIDHGMGVVMGEMSEVGDDCTIYQGVTLGGTSLERGAKRHPTLGNGVIVGANASILGGFTVGDGARVGSSAVVVKPVPPGATAVGNPARIIEAQSDAEREAAAARMGFSAYGVTQGDDPLAQAMKGLIDNAGSNDHQITMLWEAVAKLSAQQGKAVEDDCVPKEAQRTDAFDAEGLNRLVK
jgi:serine O-acetyltransferase